MEISNKDSFIIRQLELIELNKVGFLRVLAWNNILPIPYKEDHWLDEFDNGAKHWGIFHNGELIASARLTFHLGIESLPDTITYKPVLDALSSSFFAAIGRLVVHPQYQGQGLSRRLDEVRIKEAEQSGCKFILGSTADTLKRLPQLISEGFFRIGYGNPNEIAKSLGLQHLLICPLPRLKQEGRLTIPTLNGYGWNGQVPNIYTKQFISFAAKCDRPVLDIGAGLGVASKPALAVGASVIANDLELLHLLGIRADLPESELARLEIMVGHFPDDINLLDESLGAAHASNVFHFLSGEEIEKSFLCLFKWLQPGGKLFITTASPYQKYIRKFIPVFEAQKAQKKKWPGYMEDTSLYYDQTIIAHARPFLHVMDTDTISDVAQQVGFIIEECKLYSREGLPAFCRLDGRENVGLIAKKP